MNKGRMLLTLSWSNKMMEFLKARSVLNKQNSNHLIILIYLLLHICVSLFYFICAFTGSSTAGVSSNVLNASTRQYQFMVISKINF